VSVLLGQVELSPGRAASSNLALSSSPPWAYLPSPKRRSAGTSSPLAHSSTGARVCIFSCTPSASCQYQSHPYRQAEHTSRAVRLPPPQHSVSSAPSALLLVLFFGTVHAAHSAAAVHSYTGARCEGMQEAPRLGELSHILEADRR
jgi:hypothetical protein